MKEVRTNDAPPPAGHYSQAIEHNGLVYVSGQLPIDPKREEKVVGSIEEQTEQVLRNLDAILKKANSDRASCFKGDGLRIGYRAMGPREFGVCALFWRSPPCPGGRSYAGIALRFPDRNRSHCRRP